MRGLERTILLAIIAMVIVLVLALVWIQVPIGYGKWGTTQLSFEEACYFWSHTYYRGSIAENTATGQQYNMAIYCAERVGVISMPVDSSDGVPEWDKCRECCRRGACPAD